MLEIKSSWQKFGDEFLFTLFMAKDENNYHNTLIDGRLIADPAKILKTLDTMIKVLVYKLYPELNDPIFNLKSEILALEDRLKFIKEELKMREDRREKDKLITN